MVKRLSDYIAEHKGAPVLVAVLLAIINFALALLAPDSWLATSNLLLHIAVITGFLGILIGDAVA
jgi:hypothetical protein